MTKINPNLEAAWELMIENSDVFTEKDLIILLERHLNYDIAVSLRGEGSIPPCYQHTPCEYCAYVKFCRNQEQKSQKEIRDGGYEEDIEEFRQRLIENLSAVLFDGKSWGLE